MVYTLKMLQVTFCPQIQQEMAIKFEPHEPIFYSQCDYQMVNISKIFRIFTWHGFDEFGWNDP